MAAQVQLPGFRNEPYADFALASSREAMLAALAQVRAAFGREYRLRIGCEYFATGDRLVSTNPSLASQTVGVHHRASAELAFQAMDEANAFFPEWSRTPVEERARLLLDAARILRRRKFEFDAWMVEEAGKSWVEAEADTSEAIDFCEYYAREALRLAAPPELLQLPGERDEMFYIPLGAGAIIPPWNFPLAILAGMTVAALVTGNTVVIKPSSETPTIAAQFADVLLEAGFPERSFTLLAGSGGEVGDALVEHPGTRFICFTGSREVGLRINRLAAVAQPGQRWIKRVIAEMGGKDAIVVDATCDLEQAVAAVVASAFGYQGQKCSACSRAIVHTQVYDRFLQLLAAQVRALRVGPAADPTTQVGPVISAAARRNILDYIETGKGEAKLLVGGGVLPSGGHFVPPTVFAGVGSKARIFQEEIFGPVLAVTEARSFDHALELANDSEYGLTGAVFSKEPAHLEQARTGFHVGNLYLNRKCTGAMVGCHPFGGFNMSGTDSKAGGPDYLSLFTQAKSVAARLS
jgi:1-pyrroline-5-carboxylate dehydrogenase